MTANERTFMKTAIVIPARFASTRLPGKPLAMIRGKTMLERVVALSRAAANGLDADVIVATDHAEIQTHCQQIGVDVVMTDPDLPSGTDRVAKAVSSLKQQLDFILNMQADAPLTPPEFLRAMIESFSASPCDVVTPVTQLSWDELDKLRKNKESTPFSGTTAVINEATGNAYWFSKNIIPAMRKEAEMRKQNDKSPVYRHIGLYGFSPAALQKFIRLPESIYEKMEGLEQLRLLENNLTIRCVKVDYKDRASMSGVDSKEDIARAEALIDKHGELI
jgi:3-deoxy-manno-octulosonate cytidylyltransferase (CMP-KDO synthetase)